MSDIDIQIAGIMERTDTVSKGDRVKIIGTSIPTIRGGAGIDSKLIGNFPPEIGKTSSYWRAYGYENQLSEMINYVQLNTPGTYTFKTAIIRENTIFITGDYLTLIVEEPTLSLSIPVNVNGTWKDSTPSVNINGDWKEVNNAYVNVNGSWKEI